MTSPPCWDSLARALMSAAVASRTGRRLPTMMTCIESVRLDVQNRSITPTVMQWGFEIFRPTKWASRCQGRDVRTYFGTIDSKSSSHSFPDPCNDVNQTWTDTLPHDENTYRCHLQLRCKSTLIGVSNCESTGPSGFRGVRGQRYPVMGSTYLALDREQVVDNESRHGGLKDMDC